MKKLKIKTMAKDMALKDRAKLIFADCIRRAETQGEECVLEPGEEDSLVDACRKEGSVGELNRLVSLYNMANIIMSDVQLSTLKLQLVISRIETYLYFLSCSRLKEKNHDGIFVDVEDGGFVPNDLLQLIFIRSFEAVKYVQSSCLSLEYTFELAGITLLGEEDMKLIEEAKRVLNDFLKLEGVIGAMKIFSNMIKNGVVKRKDYKQKILYDFLNGKMEVVELNAEEREGVKCKIKRLIAREGHPIT
jgi:hypothetical protein